MHSQTPSNIHPSSNFSSIPSCLVSSPVTEEQSAGQTPSQGPQSEHSFQLVNYQDKSDSTQPSPQSESKVFKTSKPAKKKFLLARPLPKRAGKLASSKVIAKPSPRKGRFALADNSFSIRFNRNKSNIVSF